MCNGVQHLPPNRTPVHGRLVLQARERPWKQHEPGEQDPHEEGREDVVEPWDLVEGQEHVDILGCYLAGA